MQIIGDFHLHSKYSRATSRDMDLEHLDQWAKIKGIQVLGSTDFTHPKWFLELKNQLNETGEGIYQLKNKKQDLHPTRFILTTELSCIYSKNGKTRKIHLVIFAPNLKIVEKINKKLGGKYNLKSDGRPILGIDARNLMEIILDISSDCMIVPAHIWTPWFSLFGSKSGFNSIKECFEDLTPQIYAMETGLSSDPPMNWQWSELDQITLISNSDAHSPRNIGREANVFDLPKTDYPSIVNAIKTKKGFLSTIEFFPEEGKYHWDGHRNCGVRFNPKESKKHHNICPKCNRPLVLGVDYRVKEMADKSAKTEKKNKPKNAPSYRRIIPLPEIISEIRGVGKNSKTVQAEYFNLIKKGKNEFNILLNLSEVELKKIIHYPQLLKAILKMRKENVFKEPGYDGVYGQIKVFKESLDIKKLGIGQNKDSIKISKNNKTIKDQKSLF